jgi:hypothetical protein
MKRVYVLDLDGTDGMGALTMPSPGGRDLVQILVVLQVSRRRRRGRKGGGFPICKNEHSGGADETVKM